MSEKSFSSPRRTNADWLLHSACCIDALLRDLDKRMGYFHSAAAELPQSVGLAVTGVARAEGLRQAVEDIITARRFGDEPRNLYDEVKAALDAARVRSTFKRFGPKHDSRNN